MHAGRKFGRGVTMAAFLAVEPLAAGELQLVGTHPTSPLTAYPTIHVLQAYEGRIYMGYGNWGLYPAVVMTSYDPSNGTFRVEHSIPSDSIGMMRVIAGNLYVPSIDPPHYQGFGDFAIRSGGRWRNRTPVGMLHVFDFTTGNGNDLWFVGSKTPNESSSVNGAVFRSLDGGRTWIDMTLNPSEFRYHYCFALRGKVYVEDTVYNLKTSTATRSKLPYDSMKVIRVEMGPEEIILGVPHGIPGEGSVAIAYPLVTFDGEAWRTLSVNDVYDLTLSDGKLYALTRAFGLAVASSISATQVVWESLPISNVPAAKAWRSWMGWLTLGTLKAGCGRLAWMVRR